MARTCGKAIVQLHGHSSGFRYRVPRHERLPVFGHPCSTWMYLCHEGYICVKRGQNYHNLEWTGLFFSFQFFFPDCGKYGGLSWTPFDDDFLWIDDDDDDDDDDDGAWGPARRTCGPPPPPSISMHVSAHSGGAGQSEHKCACNMLMDYY